MEWNDWNGIVLMERNVSIPFLFGNGPFHFRKNSKLKAYNFLHPVPGIASSVLALITLKFLRENNVDVSKKKFVLHNWKLAFTCIIYYTVPFCSLVFTKIYVILIKPILEIVVDNARTRTAENVNQLKLYGQCHYDQLNDLQDGFLNGLKPIKFFVFVMLSKIDEYKSEYSKLR
ncbi:hypothetical protein BpHYR1_023728 [Brachionus plicatilis]|uniref:Uncharacterized protein n=1 Tax=Brachionus plicatilis TaxID=10195 RepID=A0A3M7RTR8_BRAPC|nr:hypothetical protein BpHYR1_023728 [Brachionus plicatilis]